jgi:serine phosphatase RsbU (regulator of sigma subunit)
MSTENSNEYQELLAKYQKLQDAYFKLKQRYIATVRELDQRNSSLFEQNKELSDSINYALRIQQAILPPDYFVKSILHDYFIFYKPKDIISGDFYFAEKIGNKVVVAAVDCTGHGVPGAMMSVIGFKYLEQAVNERKITQPSEILKFLDIGVNNSLRQTDNESGVYDGMDLAVCTIDFETKKIEYAGAFNSLYFVQDDCLVEIKSDKFPIGVNEDGVADNYTHHEFQLESGNSIYLFSDGYADQFGGEKGKKFKYGPFKELLLSIQDKPMFDQMLVLEETIEKWQGNLPQVDDILVMGIRIP